MTETTRATRSRQHAAAAPEATGWVGWILFAGMMLILVGMFQFISGLVALFNHTYSAVNSNHLVVHANYTAWGWTYLALGTLAFAAGYGVMAGRMWARIYAIFLATVSAVINLGFVNAQPVWSVMMITIDVLVIWALSVHGREVE